jgi:SnoaL-like domain
MDAVERMIAERSCERLIVEYCRRVDFGNAGGIADLFTEDAVWSGVELILDGRPAIREWFLRREGLARRVSRHVCTNIGVDVLSDDEAQSTCYLINYRHDRQEGDLRMPAPGDIPKYVGECHDRFRRTPDGWRFTARHVDVAFARPSRRR